MRRPSLVCEEVRDQGESGEQSQALAPSDIYTSSEIPTPSERPLSVYAFDPSAGRLVGNYMTASVRYEAVQPGPIGERFAVIDYDGANKTFYQPVDLNDPRLLIRGGLSPCESDPRFHQQMVYAVASETLQRFEFALGRRIHWRGFKRSADAAPVPHGASRCLNLFPHAMCQANAFYSPEAHGILFGYFRASRTNPGSNLPGQTVFTCLSHDIIAHETTHAIVDGIKSFFTEPTNIDVPAFHEAFADLAALFSHFSHKEFLLDTLEKTGGRLFDSRLKPEVAIAADSKEPVIQLQIEKANPLVALATQFGEAAGMRGALRSALGTPPNSSDINVKTEPHDRGSILVAAVFDAYFTVYTRRTSDLFRIHRAGGGNLDHDDLPTPLAERLATEASRTAEQFFVICARALDYCPPVDITFGDFLRAVLTADLDLHPKDPDGVRDAVMQAFRLRGIIADGVASFSEESLFWPKVRRDALPTVDGLQFGDPNGLTKSEKDHNGDVLRAYAQKYGDLLGFDRSLGKIQALSFHPMFHMGEDGRLFVDMVAELVQTVRTPFGDAGSGTFPMRNGVTLLISQDPPQADKRPPPRIRFVIAKLHSAEREDRVRTYYASSGRAISQKIERGEVGEAGDDARFQLDFGLLHAGA
ncbi:peptidase M4 [Bradyrhizobium sp. BRP56]|nr:peptidase M4 [Bradyrhizobium sp. BRP56]